MTSRKRNKGKERKAKNAKKEEEMVRAEAHKVWQWWTGKACSSIINNNCDHGCAVAISDDHPVSHFMDKLFVCWVNGGISAQGFFLHLKEILELHRETLNNETYLELSINLLIKIGTNILLGEEPNVRGSLSIAMAIIIIEQYDQSRSIESAMLGRVVLRKRRNLDWDISSSRRDALKFYSKRTSCSCLKEMYSVARKTLPKMGLCCQCAVEKERVSLSVCSRCRVFQYCSRECQIASWPKHRIDCDICHRQRLEDEARKHEP